MRQRSARPVVLLAEEDSDVRRLVGTLLERWGYAVEAVGSGAEALASVERLDPILAVLGVGISPPDGIELTRILKRDPSSRAVPVVLLTAHAGHGRAAEGIMAGASGYLTKPFRAQDLRKLVWAALPAAPRSVA